VSLESTLCYEKGFGLNNPIFNLFILLFLCACGQSFTDVFCVSSQCMEWNSLSALTCLCILMKYFV